MKLVNLLSGLATGMLLAAGANAASVGCVLLVTPENPNLADQFQGSTPCAFARGAVAGNAAANYSANISVAPGLIRASSEYGADIVSLGGVVPNVASPDGFIGHADGSFDDSARVQMDPNTPYVDATFAIYFTGDYGAFVGQSGAGSQIATNFNLFLDLETTKSGAQGGSFLGCAKEFSGFSDFGTACAGDPSAYRYLGGGLIADTFLFTARISDNDFFRIQLGLSTSVAAFFEHGAGSDANAGALFGHTLAYGGILSAVDPNGNAYTGPLTILGGSGFDFADSAAAPEPGTFALAGLMSLAGIAWRNRKA